MVATKAGNEGTWSRRCLVMDVYIPKSIQNYRKACFPDDLKRTIEGEGIRRIDLRFRKTSVEGKTVVCPYITIQRG